MSESASLDVATLSYEHARDELIAVVQQLEQGGTTLEQSLLLWERGELLAARCEEWLLGAKARLEKARSNATGILATTAAEAGEDNHG